MRIARLGCVLAAVMVAVPAGADEPPAKRAAEAMRKREKIANPVLTALVGTWDVTKAGAAGAGPTATARVTSVLDGTALVEESAYDGGGAFTVLFVAADGTSVTVWRFASHAPQGALVERGALSADGFDLQSDGGLVTNLRKSGDGFAVTMKGGDRLDATWNYARSTKAFAPLPSTTKHPFLGSTTGDFTTVGAFKMGEVEAKSQGTASVSAVANGAYSRTDYDAQAGPEKKLGLGVSGVSEDGKTFTYWWFTNYFDGPTLVAGDATDREWKGKGDAAPFGPFDMTWTRTATGFDLLAHFGAATLSETFTKR